MSDSSPDSSIDRPASSLSAQAALITVGWRLPDDAHYAVFIALGFWFVEWIRPGNDHIRLALLDQRLEGEFHPRFNGQATVQNEHKMCKMHG
jgi:hypothetical protein